MTENPIQSISGIAAYRPAWNWRKQMRAEEASKHAEVDTSQDTQSVVPNWPTL